MSREALLEGMYPKSMSEITSELQHLIRFVQVSSLSAEIKEQMTLLLRTSASGKQINITELSFRLKQAGAPQELLDTIQALRDPSVSQQFLRLLDQETPLRVTYRWLWVIVVGSISLFVLIFLRFVNVI